MSERNRHSRLGRAMLAAALVLLAAPAAVYAQSFIKCPPEGQPLLKIPQITRDEATKRLEAVLEVSDQDRVVWFPATSATTCATQHLRYFEGFSPVHPDEKWPVTNGVA